MPKTLIPTRKSTRKRVNKSFIKDMANFRGFMTGTEKTLLATLEVKNAIAKIATRGMIDDVTHHFNSKENAELQALCKSFAKGVNKILQNKAK